MPARSTTTAGAGAGGHAVAGTNIGVPSRDRNYDFSDVGKVGRRTGVTLAPRALDEHGLENMTGLFSSPEKTMPSTSDKTSVVESIESDSADAVGTTPRSTRDSHTPTTARNAIRTSSHNILRSASPRKSGITGSARRLGRRETSIPADHSEAQQRSDRAQLLHKDARTTAHAATTPTSLQATHSLPMSARSSATRRFDPDSTPLRNRVLSKASSAVRADKMSSLQSFQPEAPPSPRQVSLAEQLEMDPVTVTNDSPTPSRSSNSPHIASNVTRTRMDTAPTEDDVNLFTYNEEPLPDQIEFAANNSVDIASQQEPLPSDDSEAGDEAASNTSEDESRQLSVSSEEAVQPSNQGAQESVEPVLPDLPPERDDENDEDFLPTKRKKRRKSVLLNVVSRRKRKSAGMEESVAATSSPAAKRAKRRSDQGLDNPDSLPPTERPAEESLRVKKNQAQRSRPQKQRRKEQEDEGGDPEPTAVRHHVEEAEEEEEEGEEGSEEDQHEEPRSATGHAESSHRQALNKKPVNTHMSKSQQKELEGLVDKIRARPNQNKSLYILRRETPSDNTVAHTRSGRISIKPLAWWRNEGIVYGNSPNQFSDGQRFPLNSIKEIIRTEETVPARQPKAKAATKTKQQNKGTNQTSRIDPDDADSDPDAGAGDADADADDWELGEGTLRGAVSVWDDEQQAPIEAEEEVQIAYASTAIQTKDIKGANFKYTKLLTSRFFGTGVVDLPPGGVKKPKNSRKMHMSFYVVQGRVTVEVGPLNGSATKFSIGKGGFWQVPRGNQYSIENEHDKLARIFFSQACEMSPDLED